MDNTVHSVYDQYITSMDNSLTAVMSDIITIDNFYSDPYSVRDFALQQDYIKQEGNYPGLRTDSIANLNLSLLDHFADTLFSNIFKDDKEKYSYDIATCFQSIKNGDSPYNMGIIHQDGSDGKFINLAGVIYLTPDAPVEAGTTIYTPIVDTLMMPVTLEKMYTKEIPATAYMDITEYNKQFKILKQVENKFNRAVVYPGYAFHTQSNLFGKTLANSRLTQVFFINYRLL